MCDTLGFILGDRAIFGKNSDRSPNEPQVLEYLPAAVHTEETVQTTYIAVKQVRETHAVLLSRPTWLWGAEIGVNDCGVCIGNEAVWTLGQYGKTGLTGMDMVRLALERAADVKEAIAVLIGLLEEYSQGGNCGYDHSFYYDNSFLVMDRTSLYVLETAGCKWVYKSYPRAAISNRLSIGSDGDAYSTGKPYPFALRHAERAYNIASGSAARRMTTALGLKDAATAQDVMKLLRTHKGTEAPFTEGSVTSCCMHYGGLVGDHTTASMVVELLPEKTLVWATGSSCPCVSLYKPWVFGGEPDAMMRQGKAYWYAQETFRRALLGKKLPPEFYAELDALEQSWREAAQEDPEGLTERCFAEEAAFYEKWRADPFMNGSPTSAFLKRWNMKNTVFQKEMKESTTP